MTALDAPLNQSWEARWQPCSVEAGKVKEGYMIQKNLAGNRILEDPESGTTKALLAGLIPGADRQSKAL